MLVLTGAAIMSAAQIKTSTSTGSVSRRRQRRAWKIVALIVVINLGLLACLPWWRVSRARHRFEAAVAQRHARGERVLAADFKLQPIPDDQNAAVRLTRAARSLKLPGFSDRDSIREALDRRDPIPESIDKSIRQMISDNAVPLALAREARSIPRLEWKIDLRNPTAEKLLLPHLNPQRDLVELLDDVVMYNHRSGNDAEAVARLLDILRISRAMENQAFVVSFFVSAGFLAYVSDDWVTMAIDFRVSPSETTDTDGDSAASRGQVRLLMGELLNDAPCQTGMQEAWQYDRMENIATMLDQLDRVSIFGQPKMYDFLTSLLPMSDRFAAASRALTWPTARQFLASHPPGASPIPQSTELLDSAHRIALKASFQSIATRRIAATALALRLYAIDHGGHFPDRLNQLVPDYLAAIPDDPFAPGKRPLGYLPGEKPILYSVGENGIDDHGVGGKRGPWSGPDAVFPLAARTILQPPPPNEAARCCP